MCIELARDVDVAVGVKPCGELVTLVPEVRLDGEDGWFLGGGSLCPCSRFCIPQAVVVERHYVVCVGESFGEAGV